MNPEILSKIKKLLRLGKSSNQAESELALQRAYEIAQKHHVDLATIDLENEEEIEHLLIRIGARLVFEQQIVLNLVKHFFRVEIIAALPNVSFIGRATDVAIAQYIYTFLLRNCRAGLANYKKQIRKKLSRTRRQNFVQGWAYGVASKLKAAHSKLAVEDSRYALVKSEVDPAVKAAAQALYPRVEKKDLPNVRTNRTALEDGWERGREVNINTPLKAPKRLALTR